MSIVITDEISGKPIVIKQPLLAEHIKVGQWLWYNGFTSTGGWDCPAIITQVRVRRKEFRIRSLDDMVEQDQWYGFSISEDGSDSRKTMRLITASVAKAYLNVRRKALAENVATMKDALARTEVKLKHFDEVRAALKI